MAATAAAQCNKRVVLLEKMDQPGRKLRITGKGRCNLTNTAPLKDFLTHVGSDARFLRNCFARFFNTELMDFFEQRGVPLTVERGCRVFPASGKALDIFLALVEWSEQNPNVEIRKNCTVRSLILVEDGNQQPATSDLSLTQSSNHTITQSRRVGGVRLLNGISVFAPKVIITTGGLSYPTTGSTGAGYQLAKEAGHTLIDTVPSLVPLVCLEKLPDEMEAFTLKNVRLLIAPKDGKKIFDGFGELAFTADGLGGPLALSASRIVSRKLNNGEELIAHIDLKPAVESQELDHRLINDLNANGSRILNDALRLWLPAEMVMLALKSMHIEYYKRLNQINAAERKRLLNFLKDCQLTLTGTRDYTEAIVTQGGVSLKEINPKTMESRLVRGLHFAGEVLDLDGDTGGYNLQIAFSTGWAAGQPS